MTALHADSPWPPLTTGPAPPRRLETAASAGYLAAVVVAANLVLPRLLGGGWNLYLAQPVLWLGLGLYCRRLTAAENVRSLLLWGSLAGAFHVAVLAAAGLAWGFGHSTYAHQPAAVAANLVYLASMLYGVEQARACLLQRFARDSAPGAFGIAVGFAAIGIPFAQWQALDTGGDSFVFSCERLLPALAASLLATSLSSLGGAWPAIAYRGIVLGAEWLTPVLPDLTWMQTALAGTLAPATALALLRTSLGETGLAEEQRRGVPAWLVAFAAGVAAAVWLNSGALGVQPSVVNGASMEPGLRAGDIVLSRRVDPASLRAGDVIRFQNGGVPVVHRIKAVQQTSRGMVFITQGDSNDFEDAPVPASAVQGKVVLRVPGLGLVPTRVRAWLGR